MERKSDIERDSQAPEDATLSDPNIVDWDGPDDVANPMNWSTGKKCMTIGMVSFITFLSPLASTMVAPSSSYFMEEFGTTNESLGAFVTTVYILGYAVGPLMIAPASELYGRNIAYHTCNFFFFLFNIAGALANNMGSLIAFRFISGMAACCPITIGAGSIADIIPHDRRGLAMATWVLGPLFGPSLGPIIGSYLSASKGWRWNFWILAILGGFVMVLSFVMLHESYAYTLLKRKTIALRKQTGNPNLRSALESGQTSKQVFSSALIRPLKLFIFSPMVLLLSLYGAITYAYLYLLFTTFPRIFVGQYSFSSESLGLVYLGIGVGSFVGLFICGGTSDRIAKSLAEKRNSGKPKPEYRLPTMILGAIIIPVGIFLYGWTAETKKHWMIPIVGTGFLGAGIVIAHMGTSTYLVDTYSTYAASATAATTMSRALLGALLPLAGDAMYEKLGIGWGTSVLGFIAVAFLPVPIIFMKYGQRFRESKRFQLQL